ncbi:helix-turn-helix domain-containing protein [Glycomyces tenuis]|uniref:helix-turn-helix domain-containing protein n=1 Tax=Glycomyces tenuis TaxID=58116 RepID=UPI00047DAECA
MDERIVLKPRWYTMAQVAELLGYSLAKVKTLVYSGELRSLKDGGNRRILPEWVDEYVTRKAAASESLELVA